MPTKQPCISLRKITFIPPPHGCVPRPTMWYAIHEFIHLLMVAPRIDQSCAIAGSRDNILINNYSSAKLEAIIDGIYHYKIKSFR